MHQSSLTGFEKYTKKTRKEQFLEEMNRIIPWSELTQALKTCFPDPTGPGRRPKGLVRPKFLDRIKPGKLKQRKR